MKTSHNVKHFPQKLPSLELLIRRNIKFIEEFKHNSLFKLMESGFFNSVERRETFLDYFQIWANYFQRIMFLKTALCDDPRFIPMFQQHCYEELGHDQMLKRDRTRVMDKKDAILEALCNWFFSKMLTSSLYEQIVVINLCSEAAAVVFFGFAKPTIDPDNHLEHFRVHEKLDVFHEKMGLSFLENLSSQQYARLMDIQKEAWDMTNAMIQRMGELVQYDMQLHTCVSKN